MRNLNFTLQSVLMIIGILFGILTMINQGFWVLLGLVQLVLGVLQYSSSCVLMLNRRANRSVKIHWTSSTILILAIIIAYQLEGINGPFFRIAMFGMPWILALYFWYLSKRPKAGSL